MSAAFEGRSYLVTGATSGVGGAIARMLMENGARTICIGRRTARLAALSVAHPGRVEAIALDLADPTATDRFLSQLDASRLDGAVLAAGHDLGGNIPVADEDPAQASNKLMVNAAAAMQIAARVLPAFLARDRGDILAIGSIVTRVPAAGLASYAASKQALHAFIEGLRLDYAATGLRFLEIVPGVIRTEFAVSRFRGDEAAAAGFYDRFTAWLTPEDIARAALWALSQPDGVSLDEIVMRPTRR